MPRVAVEDNDRMSLRIPNDEKAILPRAAALERTNLTGFVRRHSVEAARAVIRDQEHVKLSARDSRRVLELLLAAGRRCLRLASEVGGVMLVIDAKNESVAAWYARYGAVALHDNPLTMVLPLSTARAALKAAGRE